MSTGFARRLSCALLLVFLTSLGASIFHVQRLAHEHRIKISFTGDAPGLDDVLPSL